MSQSPKSRPASGKKSEAPQKNSSGSLFSGKRVSLLLFLFAFLLYGNTIPNDYGFDDVYVTNNEEVKGGLAAIPKMFTSLYANLYEDGKDLKFGYRPVVKSTFALEYSLFGKNPHVSHLINILLYGFTALLLFKLLMRMFRGFHPEFIFLVVLFFLAHPAHTEVVASLKNRDELISLLGALGGLYFVLNFSDNRGWWNLPLGMLVLMVAYLAKPTVLVFLAIYPLAMFFFTDYRWWRIVLVALLFTAAIAFVAILPRTFLPPAQRPVQFIENPLFFETDFWIRLANGFYIMLHYLKMLFFPYPLRFYYGYDMIPVVGWTNPSVIVSAFFHLALLGTGLVLLVRRHAMAFAILIYLGTLFGFSNIFKPPMGIVADRFMYYPSIGFSILFIWLLFRAFRQNPMSGAFQSISTGIRVVALLILVLFSGMTIARNRAWDTPRTLFDADMSKLERSARANLIYAGTLRSEVLVALSQNKTMTPEIKKKIDLVFKHLGFAVDVYPDYYQAWNMLGSSYLSFLGNSEKARDCFLQSVRAKPDFYHSYFNLGKVYQKLDQRDSAMFYFHRTLEVYPSTFQPHLELMKMYRESGDFEKAVFHGKEARELKAREEQKGLERKGGPDRPPLEPSEESEE